MSAALRLLAALALVVATRAVAGAEAYVVSPAASPATKAAVAAGIPPEHGFPQIEDVEWTMPPKLHPGTQIRATVRTSPNVGYVEGRVKYWNVAFAQVGPGMFRLDYRIPLLPPSAVGRWTLEVIARSVDGVEVRRSFPVVYTYL